MNAFEEKLKAANEAYFGRDTSRKRLSLPRWALALAACLLLIILFFIGRRFYDPASLADPEKIYAQYAQHEFSLQEMNAGAELGELQALLDAGQYGAALSQLDAYLSDHPEAAEVLLAKGVALIETDQPEQALDVFQTLAEQHPLYQTESLWYTALVYLKMGQLNECLATLQRISDDSSRFEKAQRLRRVVEKMME